MIEKLGSRCLLIGLDIGGVNIKCSSIPLYLAARIENAFSTKDFYPLWLNSPDVLNEKLSSILLKHVEYHQATSMDDWQITIHPCASITGELSDAFFSKLDGITRIINSLDLAIKSIRAKRNQLHFNQPLFVSTDGVLRDSLDAIAHHRLVAASNWCATAAWVGSLFPDCLLIDCGSTTTDIIPILSGSPKTLGTTDLGRLQSGELVYTGVLRSTIPSIAHSVPVGDGPVPVSFEKFALMADVHAILGHITMDQYDCDTADGRSTSIEDCKRRLARTVCEDANVLGDEIIMQMARYLHETQVSMVREGLAKVKQRLLREFGKKWQHLECVVTGLGETVLAKPAADLEGFTMITLLSSKIGVAASIASSAIGVLHVLARYLQEKE